MWCTTRTTFYEACARRTNLWFWTQFLDVKLINHDCVIKWREFCSLLSVKRVILLPAGSFVSSFIQQIYTCDFYVPELVQVLGYSSKQHRQYSDVPALFCLSGDGHVLVRVLQGNTTNRICLSIYLFMARNWLWLWRLASPKICSQLAGDPGEPMV